MPTVAAMGSRAPKGAATKHTEQSAHQAVIWVALEYAGQCLSKGSKVTLTVESATALRNLHDAPADEEARPGAAAQGGVAARTPHRDGARPISFPSFSVTLTLLSSTYYPPERRAGATHGSRDVRPAAFRTTGAPW